MGTKIPKAFNGSISAQTKEDRQGRNSDGEQWTCSEPVPRDRAVEYLTRGINKTTQVSLIKAIIYASSGRLLSGALLWSFAEFWTGISASLFHLNTK